MSRFAINLNDAEITLSDGQKTVYREPGFAYLGSDQLTTGARAFSQSRIDPRRIQHRFWSELDTSPFNDQRFAHLSSADLASKQLEDIWAGVDEKPTELIVSVPGYMTPENLGLLLGIAGELQLPVVALVDAAVAATRREYKGAVPVHVDLSLHKATLTRLAQPGMAQIDRKETLDGAGIYALYDIWLKTISETFVQQSRFDPLHTAETEQMLLDQMGGWLRQACQADSVAMQVTAGGTTYHADAESLSLVGAAAPVYQQIASKLRALFRAEDLPAVQVTDRVGRLPGLVDMLEARIGGEVFVLEPGATARGALARCRGKDDAADGVSLLRQLPWDQVPVELDKDAVDTVQKGLPTHLLFGHNGYEIGNSPLVIGSQEGVGDRFLAVPADMPGVSRRHCSLLRKNGQCVLEDHSRYGTFLNGHKVDGSSVLQVGDALRIGSPGFEFQLITTDVENG